MSLCSLDAVDHQNVGLVGGHCCSSVSSRWHRAKHRWFLGFCEVLLLLVLQHDLAHSCTQHVSELRCRPSAWNRRWYDQHIGIVLEATPMLHQSMAVDSKQLEELPDEWWSGEGQDLDLGVGEQQVVHLHQPVEAFVDKVKERVAPHLDQYHQLAMHLAARWRCSRALVDHLGVLALHLTAT